MYKYRARRRLGVVMKVGPLHRWVATHSNAHAPVGTKDVSVLSARVESLGTLVEINRSSTSYVLVATWFPLGSDLREVDPSHPELAEFFLRRISSPVR